jgi:hypothetical protein
VALGVEAVTDVTVPVFWLKHTPKIAKHPPDKLNPLEAVDVAVPVRFSAVPAIPAPNVLVAALCKKVFAPTVRSVVDAPPLAENSPVVIVEEELDRKPAVKV